MTYEGLRLKILKIKRKMFAPLRKKKLKFHDFTIISNNCWGGCVYESYGLQKKSPTVGLFMFAEDYIKFVRNLKKYANLELNFIKPEESKWKNFFEQDKNFGTYPIGLIQDIEIFFLHYHSRTEAKEKWERRCKRINWEKILIKFNDQNNCSEEDVKHFFELPYKNKLFFTIKDWPNIDSKKYIKIKQNLKSKTIRASYEPLGKNKYIDLNNLINNL